MLAFEQVGTCHKKIGKVQILFVLMGVQQKNLSTSPKANLDYTISA
jgi:hypothetical protein